MFNIKLENFEGPLDLLLYFIKRDKIDIYDIPITQITNEYIAVIDEAKKLDVSIAGEFLFMASMLLRIKTQMLLPRQIDEESLDIDDPRIDLVAQNFQIRGKDGKITPIEVNDKVKIQINGDQYKLHAINTTEFGEIGILRECIELDNISLYYFPRKKLQKPIEAGFSAPTSGYGKTDNPEWRDDGFYFFELNGKYLEVPTKYKKLLDLKIFDEEKLKAFRKKYKLDLRKEGKLIELVKYFNEN